MSGGKLHLAGILVGVGLVLARAGDDCAGIAARSARHVDGVDLARTASRAPLPDGASAHLAAGLDDPARLAAAASRSAGQAAHVDDVGAHVLREVGPDVGLELFEQGIDDLPDRLPPAANVGRVACPRTIALSEAPAEWEALRGGLGVACAPIVVLGRVGADLRSMQLAGRDAPLAELARECLLVGARCTFVGCRDAACVAATRASYRATAVQPLLARYLADLVARLARQDSPPAVIATPVDVDGRARLALARPGPDPPPPPPSPP
ncbi:MAG: hypothetical protein JNL82_03470 [Myxococcales bacterium]|nr:hypothetical protein [Myxococcales bacterium]